MTVDEYVKIRKDELDAFAACWNKGARSESSNYPTDLEEGDWYEQELAYNGSTGRDAK